MYLTFMILNAIKLYIYIVIIGLMSIKLNAHIYTYNGNFDIIFKIGSELSIFDILESL